MIRFIKILRYDLAPQGADGYDHMANVAAGTIDPPTLEIGGLSLPGVTIFHSPLRRAVGCIDCSVSVACIPMPELAEIPFDMRALCTRAEWAQQGSFIVRRGFKQAFIADTLPVKRAALLDEIERALGIMRAADTTHPVAAISHSFRLKLIEAYIRTGGRIRNEPERIQDFIRDAGNTYNFGGGFDAE